MKFFTIILFSMCINAISWAKTSDIEISRPVVRLLVEARAITETGDPKLYHHRCYLEWAPQTQLDHRIFCVNELDPIITREYLLKGVTFNMIGRSGKVFRIDESTFARGLYNAMQRKVGDKEFFVSNIKHCPSKGQCFQSYSTDLSEKPPNGILTCMEKKEGSFQCLISPR